MGRGGGFLLSAVLVPICSLVGHEVWLLTANLRYRTSRPDAVATMTAVTYSAHGKARAVLEVGAVAQPQQPPAQGMLVIRVVAAALNPVDFKQLRNDQPDALVPKPRTLGFDVSGVVVAAGEGSGFDIGDAVYGMLPLVGSPWGALSEFTVAEAKCFAKAPRTIPLEQAAALPLVSLTVMQVFEQAGLLPGEDRKGQTILIQAAAGGVGSFAVQYARNVLGFGNVLGTCSAPNELLVRELGATATIDYTKTSFEEVAREAPDPSLACKCSSRRPTLLHRWFVRRAEPTPCSTRWHGRTWHARSRVIPSQRAAACSSRAPSTATSSPPTGRPTSTRRAFSSCCKDLSRSGARGFVTDSSTRQPLGSSRPLSSPTPTL